MNDFTLPYTAIREKNPMAVMPDVNLHTGENTTQVDSLSGEWSRVFPQTARDVSFIQSLVMHIDRFAPATGHGVLVAARHLPAAKP